MHYVTIYRLIKSQMIKYDKIKFKQYKIIFDFLIFKFNFLVVFSFFFFILIINFLKPLSRLKINQESKKNVAIIILSRFHSDINTNSFFLIIYIK